MVRALGALGVEPGERRVLLCGAAALFLLGWASVATTNVSETLFLKRVGIAFLPWVFLVNSLLLAATTFAMGRLAVRVEHRRLLTWTFIALGLALLPLWLLVGTGLRAALALLVIAAKQLDAIGSLALWTTLGGILSGRQGKRLFAPMAAGGTLGTICGSFTSAPLGRAVGITTLLPLAALTLLLGAVATVPLRRFVPRRFLRPAGRVTVTDEPTRRLLPLWNEGWLFRVLVLTSLFAGMLGPILYFELSFVADRATRGTDAEQRLLEIYALVRGGINVGVLLVQLGGTAAVFRRVGVPLASALSPLIYLLGLVGLSVELSLGAGIAASAGASLQDHAVYDPAQRVLVTLFPERVRATVTTLIDGPVKRAGGVIGNLAIIAALAISTPVWVGRAGLPIAAAWLVLALVLWRAYPRLLLEAATAGGDDATPLTELLDAGTVRMLERHLVDPDPERCRAACELVVEAPRARAAAALARALRTAPASNRALLIAALARVVEEGETPITSAEAAHDVAALLALSAPLAGSGGAAGPSPAGEPRPAHAGLVQGSDGAATGPLGALERARLVQIHARLLGRDTPPAATRALLLRASEDESEAVRVAATAALRRAASAPAGDDGGDALLAALASDDPPTRQIAREEIRHALAHGDDHERAEPWLGALVAHLASPVDRPHAAAVLAAVAPRHGARLRVHGTAILAHRTDPDPRVRTAVLRLVEHSSLTPHADWVAEHLDADDPAEAAAARRALEALGLSAADVLLRTLRFGRRRAREAVLPLLRRLSIETASLRALVERELGNVRRLLLQADGLGGARVSELVLQRLRERIDERVHIALLLLAALLDDDRIAHVCHFLGRAWSVRERAVLLEALESILPAAECEALLPLLDDRSPQALARTAARALGRPLLSFEEAVVEVLTGDDPLAAALLASTLDPALLARLAPAVDRPADQHVLVPRRSVVPAAGGVDPPTAPASAHPGVDHPRSSVSYDTPGPGMLRIVETILHLRSLDLFDRLTTQQLTDLAGVVEEVRVPADTAIVREGEFDECMYFIVEGRVRVTKGDQPVAELGPREFFGEMAVFDGETRSATASAVGPARLLRLARHDLFEVMDEQPAIAIAICQTLSRRVRDLLDERTPPAESRRPSPRER